MASAWTDLLVVGAGIVGLATARAWQRRFPGASVIVIDKESGPAAHQTGRNSGVIHSGVYYPPNSLKARATISGRRQLIDYCAEHGIAHELCGKVIVATREDERARLTAIAERGQANGVTLSRICGDKLREIEPGCAGVDALHVSDAGIVDYRAVCEAMVLELRAGGADVSFGEKITGLKVEQAGVKVISSEGEYSARQVINCAGLYSDRVALETGTKLDAQIVPFRGEYFELKESARSLCRHLIYPVPNPDFPFLGVHLTRMVTGGVEAGPNAVLAMAREGYDKWTADLRELSWTLTYGGFWALVAAHWQEGLKELWRSLSKAAFCRSLQRLVPELTEEDLIAAPSGVRAQAVLPGGGLADDFVVSKEGPITHVINAPSPAATASFTLAEIIVERALAGLGNQ